MGQLIGGLGSFQGHVSERSGKQRAQRHLPPSNNLGTFQAHFSPLSLSCVGTHTPPISLFPTAVAWFATRRIRYIIFLFLHIKEPEQRFREMT